MADYSKVYLILGANGALGLEVLAQLNERQQNALFLAHYHSDSSVFESIVPRSQNKIVPLKADFAEPADVAAFIEHVRQFTDAPTHILHTAALPFEYMRLKDFDRDCFLRDLQVQVLSFAELCKAFVPVMVKRKAYNKVVVVVTSYVTESTPKFMLSYITVKHALLGLVKSLAADYAGKKININAVSPGMIETPFLRNIDSRLVQMVAENSPEGRIATAKDIAGSILFLLSEEANYVHGQNLLVTNGAEV